jgi:hypothetical protein
MASTPKPNLVLPKILTNIRIDEVSAVDKGAGEGVKIMLMKRDDDDRDRCDERLKRRFPWYDPRSYKEPASDVIAKATAALAESVGSIINATTVRPPRSRRLIARRHAAIAFNPLSSMHPRTHIGA